jgi:hypothetical protein
MSPARKIAINARLGRDLLRLSGQECIQLEKAAGIDQSLWLPRAVTTVKALLPNRAQARARAMKRLGSARRQAKEGSYYRAALHLIDAGRHALRINPTAGRKYNLVNFSRLRFAPPGRTRADFIREIIIEKKPYRETTLYQQVMAGQAEIPRGKIEGSEAELRFHRYYEYCITLAESIRKSGLRETRTASGSIRAAIDQNGRFLYLTNGGHRLAIAEAFDIQTIPVRVRLISGEYFKCFLNHSFSEAAVLAAIKAAVDQAAQGRSD